MGIVHKFKGNADEFEWDGVEAKSYNGGDFSGVVKRILVGESEGAKDYIVRYFEIAPGGHSRLETHSHDHGVVILRGKATVQLNEDFYELEPFDSVYVAGNDLHQFVNNSNEALGFICVINGKI